MPKDWVEAGERASGVGEARWVVACGEPDDMPEGTWSEEVETGLGSEKKAASVAADSP